MGSFRVIHLAAQNSLTNLCLDRPLIAFTQIAQSTIMHVRITHVGIREEQSLANKAYTGK